jgi:hypothetical protein
MNYLNQSFIEKIAGRVPTDRIKQMLKDSLYYVKPFSYSPEMDELNIVYDSPTCISVALWAGHLEHLIYELGPREGFNEGHGFYYFPNPNEGPPIVGPAVFQMLLKKYGYEEDQGGLIVSIREKDWGNKEPPFWEYDHIGLLSDSSSSPLIFDMIRPIDEKTFFSYPPTVVVDLFREETSDNIRTRKVYLPRGI